MADNYNDKFEEWKNGGKIEQVPKDMFAIMEAQAQDKPDNETAMTEKGRGGTKKTSFAELRQGRKIPRLKKSMVLTIITGGVFVFLMLVNLIVQKQKNEEKKYFDEQKNAVAVGSEFSLGDLEKKVRHNEIEQVEVIASDEHYFKSPPAYAPVQAERVPPPGGGPPRYAPYGGYSDSDLLAVKAQIGKDGGYGLARNANYTSPGNYIPPENFTPAGSYNPPIPTREEYTRQRIDDITRLTQMTNNDDSTRYTDAGRYNPNNPPRGADTALLSDACLFPGTIIHAILVSRIDTDYPGPIHARVIENIYDSKTGKNLLIPQGTILQGNYSSSSIGVSKVQIAWESMVVNYQGVAYQVSLGGMAGVDKRGRAGIAGTLDDHYFEWLKAAGIVSLFTVLNSEISYQTKNQSNVQIRELMDINQGIINQLGNKLIQRALDIQPTVRVANGTAVSVSVNAVVNLRPFPAIRAEERWIRK
jgi:type IV secretion system protein VirB10